MHITTAEAVVVMVVALATILLGSLMIYDAAGAAYRLKSLGSQIFNVSFCIAAGLALTLALITSEDESGILTFTVTSVGWLMLVPAYYASIDSIEKAATVAKGKIKESRYRRLRVVQLAVTAASVIFGAALMGLMPI